jgi:hypothetical protein
MKGIKLITCVLLAIALIVFGTGCSKDVSELAPSYANQDKVTLSESEFELVYADLEQTKLWRYETLHAFACDSAFALMSVEERYAYLKEHMLEGLPERNTEAQMETMASKYLGSTTVNGGRYVWDADAGTLALTLASMGTVGDPRSPLNYYDHTNGSITWVDASRAAQGYYNTSPTTNNAIEITNIVYLNQVSGDGNWLIGANVTVAGVTTVYDAANPLIYDPVPGGITIVGPMPGGYIEVVGNGTWPLPPSDEMI